MLLSSEDHARIKEAVRLAETATRGEIVCVVADEASHYREVPLAWAAAGALLLPIAPLTLSAAAVWLDGVLRGWNAAHVAASHATVMSALGGYALAQCVTFIVIALVASIPPVRRFLTPASLRRTQVHQRAMEQFLARDLQNTQERTGLLIYVSLKDRIAEVIADAGINAKVGARAWDDVVSVLVKTMKAGRPGDAFVTAVATCGDLLAVHFPAHASNPNELADVIDEVVRS